MIHPRSISLICCIFLLWFLSCAVHRDLLEEYTPPEYTPSIEVKTEEDVRKLVEVPTAWVDNILKTLTLEEKVGQMIMARAFAHYMSEDAEQYRDLIRLVAERKIGGVAFFQGDVSELALLTNDLQRRADIPLLLAADFERGTAMRLRRGTLFPIAMALGATREPSLVYRMAKAIAKEGRALGIHQNFAPVVDVNNNPDNPVINVRSFGENPYLVAEMTEAYILGLHDGGMISTAKHFPGHGDTDIDSHIGLPIIPHDRIRLDTLELIPFRHAITHGVMSIMSAHIALPAIAEERRKPATMSPRLMTNILRDELGFSGVIVTDAMEMHAITRGYSVGEAAIRSVLAGADIILLPPDVDEAIESIVAAVRLGRIPELVIDESVRRILSLKYWAGLHKYRLIDPTGVRSIVANREHRDLALEIARKSITLVSNSDGILPLRPSMRNRVLVVVVSDREDQRVMINRPETSATNEPVGSYFIQLLRDWGIRPEVIRLDPRSNQIDFDSLQRKVNESSIVIGALYVQARSGEGQIGLPPPLMNALVRASESPVPFVLVSFGDPYYVRNLSRVKAYLCAYHANEFSIRATVETLVGANNPSGKLPVTIPGVAPYGTGLSYIALPREEVVRIAPGFTASQFTTVDSLIEHSIVDGAFPGAVVAIGNKNGILYQRAFGKFTYDQHARSMSLYTMFDIASLTKVVATTTSIMLLYERGKIGLDTPVADYVPEFGVEGKETITVRQLLLHIGGLPPFKEYYLHSSSPEEGLELVYRTSLEFEPGARFQYSDIGMIVLAKAVERISGVPFDEFVFEEILKPLGMSATTFNPPRWMRFAVAPTEFDSRWRGRLIQGEVHDENAARLGGIAGHAGLFSTSGDLTQFAMMMLSEGSIGENRFLQPETIRLFITPSDTITGRGLGWDTRAGTGYSSAGTLFSNRAFGHTGFTGTSLWIDPVNNLFVIFLTNRVYPDRGNNSIRMVRPALHDMIMQSLKLTVTNE